MEGMCTLLTVNVEGLEIPIEPNRHRLDTRHCSKTGRNYSFQSSDYPMQGCSQPGFIDHGHACRANISRECTSRDNCVARKRRRKRHKKKRGGVSRTDIYGTFAMQRGRYAIQLNRVLRNTVTTAAQPISIGVGGNQLRICVVTSHHHGP